LASKKALLTIVAGSVLMTALASGTALGTHMSISNQSWRLVFTLHR